MTVSSEKALESGPMKIKPGPPGAAGYTINIRGKSFVGPRTVVITRDKDGKPKKTEVVSSKTSKIPGVLVTELKADEAVWKKIEKLLEPEAAPKKK